MTYGFGSSQDDFVFLLQEGPNPIKLGANEYACPFCTSTMKKRDHMEQHILTHTGVKPFSCKLCTSNFTRKSSLQRHLEKMHLIPKSEKLHQS